MKIMVLGGAGFIGSHLVEELVRIGHDVLIFGRKPSVALSDNVRQKARFIYGDFNSTECFAQKLKDIDIVYHLISATFAKTSNEDPLFDLTSNVCSTLNMLIKAKELNVRKIVFVSSGGTVYGVTKTPLIPETHKTDPICAYGISKLAIEKYLYLFNLTTGLDYTVLRVSNPYGERQSPELGQGVINTFIYKIIHNLPIEVFGNAEIIRDYIHISDVVAALIRCAENTGDEKIFNIGSGVGYTLKDIITYLRQITGGQLRISWLPGRNFDVPKNVLDITRAKNLLGWKPQIKLREGMSSLYKSLLRVYKKSA